MNQLKDKIQKNIHNNIIVKEIPYITEALQPKSKNEVSSKPLNMLMQSINYLKKNGLINLLKLILIISYKKVKYLKNDILLGTFFKGIVLELNINTIEKVYNDLSDNYSKELYLTLIAYRLLGPCKVKLPLSNKESWREITEIEAKCQKDESYLTKHWTLYLEDLHSIGYPIKYYTLAEGIFINFYLKQYEYNREINISPSQGDYVIDGGACFGDTSLLFAQQVGNSGKVFSFEFVQDNLDLFQINLNLNPNLKRIIEVHQFALWSESDKELSFSEEGAASKIVENSKNIKNKDKVCTISLDDFINRTQIEQVHFIKLDIEGAELDCLKGAKEVIAKFKPKLAICIYHKFEHFVTIPGYIKEIVPEYNIFIDHYSAHYGETVMYAKIPDRNIK